MPASHHIAVLTNRDGLDSQTLLSNAAAAWRASGLKVAGVIAESRMDKSVCSAGSLRDLASGQVFSIRLASPAPDTDCDLDASGLEQAAVRLLEQVAGADVLVLSKFGKAESMQGGLWPVFQAALAAGKPLLTTISPKHNDAWMAFAPKAVRVRSEPDAIESWWRAQSHHRDA